MSKQEDWWLFPGFEIETVASGLDVPVALASTRNQGNDAKAPLLYVAELHGQIKALTSSGRVYTYADGLLNYAPERRCPRPAESGLTDICVEPASGDLFLSFTYVDGSEVMAKVVRTSSSDGLKMDQAATVIGGIPSTAEASQIEALTIGFDGKLYVNVAAGLEPDSAQNDDDLRGKILRLNLDGTIPDDNPNKESPVYAKGLRKPFGAAWRQTDKSLYVSASGPGRDDVIAKVRPGGNHGWPVTMRGGAALRWEFPQGPRAMAFMQAGEFPREYHDHLFVALVGAARAGIRSPSGRKIVKLKLDRDGVSVRSYDEFVTYLGTESAAPCGLAFGPGGLYFSDCHSDGNGSSNTPGGSVYRIKPKGKLAKAILRGVTVAETDQYETAESCVYFPPESVLWQHLAGGETQSVNPRIGQAFHFDVAVWGTTIRNGAWCYPEPKDNAKHITGYVAFADGEIQVRTERDS